MDPAVPGRGSDAFPERRLRPLPGPPVVRDLAARADHVAVHGTGHVQPELPADRGQRSLVDQGEAFGDVPFLHQGDTLVRRAQRLQVAIAEPLPDVGAAPSELDGLVQVASERSERLAGEEVAVLRPFGLGLEDPLCSVEPTGGYRPGELRAVLAIQYQRDVRSPDVLLCLDVARVRALEGIDRVVRAHRPPRRLRHRLEVFRAEQGGRVRLREELEPAIPLLSGDGLPRCS